MGCNFAAPASLNALNIFRTGVSAKREWHASNKRETGDLPPPFARKFSSRERHLGTRQVLQCKSGSQKGVC